MAPVAGTDNNFITSGTGILNLAALSPTVGGRFNVTLLPTTSPTSSSQVTYTIATFGSIVGSSGTISSGTDVSNLFTYSGSFIGSSPTMMVSGTSLTLTFTPVPEPTTVLASCAGAAGAAGLLRRRRRPSI